MFWIKSCVLTNYNIRKLLSSLPLAYGLICAPVLLASDHSYQQIKEVSAEEMIEIYNSNINVLIIDSRFPADRRIGYIEGSINLPDSETNCTTLSKLTSDKAQSIIFYCNGAKCRRSAHAVHVAQQCGYQNILWFRGGYEEWRKKKFPVLK